MASRGTQIETRRPAPRLYLMTPPVGDPAAFADALAAALGAAADIAAVCLRLADADERTLSNRIKALAPVVQDKGAALLLGGHVELVARTGADGAHLTGIESFQAALAALKPQRIAGCGGLETRHDAMLAAESADYVMFGEPNEHGTRPSFDAIVDRIAWWAEVFELPCVGFAVGHDEVEPLAAAGADFVALGEWIFSAASDPAAQIAEAANRLAAGHRALTEENVA